jgi:hypothetical protein
MPESGVSTRNRFTGASNAQRPTTVNGRTVGPAVASKNDPVVQDDNAKGRVAPNPKPRKQWEGGSPLFLVTRLVTSVDERKRTITVSANLNNQKLRRANGLTPAPDETFEVPAGARIDIDGKPGKLSDIATGAGIALRLSSDRKSARAILSFGPFMHGRVNSVNAGKRILDLEQAAGPLKGWVDHLLVAQDATVEMQGKSVKFGDLPVGANVSVSLSGKDRKTVVRIQEGGPGKEPGVAWGKVKSVDLKAKAVSVTNEEAARSFTVPDEARVTIDGKPGKLAAVQAGMEVFVETRGRAVVAVEARRPSQVATKE